MGAETWAGSAWRRERAVRWNPVPWATDHTRASPFLPAYPRPRCQLGAHRATLQICERQWAPGLEIPAGIDRTASEPIQSALPCSTLDPRCVPLPAACAMSDALRPPFLSCFLSPPSLPIRIRRATGAASGRQRATHDGPRRRPASGTVRGRSPIRSTRVVRSARSGNAHHGGRHDADAHHACAGRAHLDARLKLIVRGQTGGRG
jgi:hypothetical protein